MSYKCMDCGRIFQDGEQARWLEDYGECWGVAARKEETGCPVCKGAYDECVKCEICGAEHLEDELCGGVCEQCIEKYKYDVDMCAKIGSNDTCDVPIDCFLQAMFSPEEINTILLDVLKKARELGKVDCSEFINADREWFAERLAEEVKQDEN